MTQANDKTNNSYEILLEYLKDKRGFDFTGYKRASLRRRIGRRMQIVEVETPEEYLDYLEVHPDEFVELFNTILINVTSFFRDNAAWEYLDTQVIPEILAGKEENEPIRVWCAGVASGEEVYTVSILLAEHMGLEGFKRRVKVYATDLDEDALSRARLASYSAKEVESIPANLLEKYFDVTGHHYVFEKDLRRSIIFGRHDLIKDAPISRIDLLICRNLLMYFNAETQASVLERLHFALNDSGFLFLGKVEMLFTHTRLFMPLDIKQRVFTKVSVNRDWERVSYIGPGLNGHTSTASNAMETAGLAFENSVNGQMVVDRNDSLVMANKTVRQMFHITSADINKPIQDLRVSYQPVDLRSAIELARNKGREPVVVKEVNWESSSAGDLYLNIIFKPLFVGEIHLGVLVTFIDVTEHKRLQNKLEHTNQELETAMEELESTNEELETTNEELQSTIEELETTNEELQSTNEELETMNEELQSTNEELETMNDELTQRTVDLNQAYAFLSSILSGIHGGVIVVDQELRVQAWNEQSEEMWGLRSEEAVGANLLSLDIGLPVERLRRPILNLLNHDGRNEEETLLDAVNRRGKSVTVRIRATRLISRQQAVEGVILIIEQDSGENLKSRED